MSVPGGAKLVAAAVVLLALAAVAGVGGWVDGAGTSRGAADRVLRIGITADRVELDPGQAAFDTDLQLSGAVFSTLMALNEHGRAVPLLAERVTASSDGRTYTVTLRKDARWSDGRPVTASDVVYAWRRNVTPATESQSSYLMMDIEGAEAVLGGAHPSRLAVAVVDDSTVTVRLRHPVPWFPELLGFAGFAPVPSHIVRRFGVRWTDPASVACSGAYCIERVASDRLTLKRNEYYAAGPRPQSDRIEVALQQDRTLAAQFRAGRLDVALVGVDSDLSLAGEPGFREFGVPLVSYLLMNVRSSRMSVTDRRNIANALDRSELMRRAYVWRGVATERLTPEGLPGASVVRGAERRTADRPVSVAPRRRLVLAYSGESRAGRDEALEVQRQLWAAGYDVRLRVTHGAESDRVQVAMTDTGVDMVSSGWIADYPDASSYLGSMRCEGPYGNGFCDRRVDELLDRAAGARDPAARYELERQVEHRLTGPRGSFPVVPLYATRSGMLVSSRVESLPTGWHGIIRFDLARVRR